MTELKAPPDLRKALEAVAAIVWTVDPETRAPTYVSSSQLNLGWPKERWTDPAFWPSIINPDDFDALIAANTMVLETGEGQSVEFRMRTASGEWRWYRAVVGAVRSEEGAVIALAGVTTDVTHEKQAHETNSIRLEIALAIAEASNAPDALLDVLAVLGRAFNSTITTMWQLSHDHLRLAAEWTEDHSEPIKKFLEDGKTRIFELGEGIPGTVTQTGEPLYRSFPTPPEFSIRDATNTGLAEVAGFAVKDSSGRVVGVVELFNRPDFPLNRKLADELFEVVGLQLGNDLVRREGERARLKRNRVLAASDSAFAGKLRSSSVLAQLKRVLKHEWGDTLRFEPDGTPVDSRFPKIDVVARGQVLGHIVASTALSDSDRLLLRELASRTALAFDAAQEFERRTEVAMTLSRKLIPPRPAPVDGLDIGVRFSPAGEGTEIGGDFFDVFALPDGRTGILIGDVVGKGAEAAVTTAMARFALRAASMHHSQPSLALKDLNKLLLLPEHEDSYCSAVLLFVGLGPRGCTASMCCAGHPPPFKTTRSGEIERLPADGLVIGLFEDPPLVDRPVFLGQDERVVVFTDGVTEARGGSGQFGEDRVAEVLAQNATRSAQAIVDALGDAVLRWSGLRPSDDVAVLAVGPTGRPTR